LFHIIQHLTPFSQQALTRENSNSIYLRMGFILLMKKGLKARIGSANAPIPTKNISIRTAEQHTAPKQIMAA